MNIGVVVGRFQAPELHKGHVHVLSIAQQRSDVLVVVIGVAPRIDKRNPLDYAMRAEMVRKVFPQAVILPLEDQREDAEWVRRLDSLLYHALPGAKFTIFGSRDSCLDIYKKHPHYNDIAWVDKLQEWNATDERAKAFARYRLEGPSFAAGIIHAVSHVAPQVVPAVDIAIVRSTGSYADVLMINKAGEEGVRFPGGHVERFDTSYEAAGIRELREEVGLETKQLTAVGSYRINDWRYRDCGVITTLFTAPLSWCEGIAKTSAEAASVSWVPLEWERRNVPGRAPIMDEHTGLFDAVLEHYGKDSNEDDREFSDPDGQLQAQSPEAVSA